MQKDEQIQNIVRELADDHMKNGGDNAALVLTAIDNRMSASVVGKENDLIMLVAKAIAEAPDLAKVFEAGIAAAPLVELLFSKGQSTETCECATCVERRRQKATNPNVN